MFVRLFEGSKQRYRREKVFRDTTEKLLRKIAFKKQWLGIDKNLAAAAQKFDKTKRRTKKANSCQD